MISATAELFGLGQRELFEEGVEASPFKVSKRKCSFSNWTVAPIPFPSNNWRTRREREPVTPRQKEAPLFWVLCPCWWVSLGWVSFAREQAEEDGRFWFLWILGWLGFA